ncbi:uncharacterized protein LOC143628374 [Bidens hawaiensis]|uniref:uncharacterized protein LOC143628374 n=1 Tax=Bidens hawaiensis TaxID=980011 RepID=UPI00404AADB0
MLANSKLRVQFWNEAVNTTYYMLNRVLMVKKFKKMSYELLNNRKSNLKYLEPFGCPCTVLKKDARKFDEKAFKGYFLGYNSPKKRVFNISSGCVEEWFHVHCQSYITPPTASNSSIGGFGLFGTNEICISTLLIGPQLAFSNCDNAQGRGSRIAVYRKTTSEDAADGKEKLITSISAMTPYKTKNHEELRWEDYNFTRQGGFGLISSAVKPTSQGTASIFSTSVKPSTFGPTFPSSTSGTASWNYTGPTFNSFTSKPFQFSHSATSYFPTAPSNSVNPFTTSTPSNSFSPFTTSTTSNSFSPFTTCTPSNSFIIAPNPFTTSTSSNLFSPFTTQTPSNSFSPFTTSTPTNTFSPFTTPTPTNSFSPFTTSTPTNTFSPFTTATPTNSFSPFTTSTPTNTFSPFTTSTPINTFSPFTTSTPTNTYSPFTTSTPANSFSPFTTSTPTNTFSPFTTSTPTNSFSPFTTSTPSSLFSPFTTSTPTNSFSPFTTSTPTNSFSPFTTSTPSNSFNPFTFPASTTASSVSFAPLNNNLFTNSSTSPASNLFTNTSSSYNTFSPSATTYLTTVTSAPSNSFNPFTPRTNLTFPVSTTSSVTLAPLNQNTASHMSSSQITTMEKPSSVASPFGVLPPSPRVYFDGYQLKQQIQYGISSIPVKDKPAPVKYSLLTTRHCLEESSCRFESMTRNQMLKRYHI